jgi:hypothetical protein
MRPNPLGGEQNRKQQAFGVPEPDKLIRYRHNDDSGVSVGDRSGAD